MPTCHDVRGLARDEGALYYGDNLQVLRDSIATENVDLIYLDPPFNSNATYNVLFRSPRGNESQALTRKLYSHAIHNLRNPP
jgi:16S rRNA G966 N2-methylase RsmD